MIRRIKIIIVGCICVITLHSQENTVELKGSIFVHDPVMIKQDTTYYIFHTGRGISIKSSTNKITWRKSGDVFKKDELPVWHKDDIPEHNGHLWAPDIHYRNGRYHLYYSVSAWMNFNSSIGYATNATLDTSDTNYKWIDHGKVISYKNGGEGVNVIDPNIFVENDKVWLLYGSYKAGLRIVEINPETGLLKYDPPKITIITTSLGEGVFLLKSVKYYYIFASRGICCKGLESNYQVVIGRSKNIMGPYLNKEGESWVDNHYSIFLAGDYDEPGRGHNGFFTENDTTFIVYHAYSREYDGKSILRIQPVYVNKEGWPTMKNTGDLLQVEECKFKEN